VTPASHPAARVVLNARASRDWNTCGLAAAATVLAFHAAGPFDHGARPSDAEAIDRVGERFPPDLPFGLGTSPWRIAAALRAHGLRAEVIHAGPFGLGLARTWDRVLAHARDASPVPVCLDGGLIGGTPWSAHWAVLLGIEAGLVRLGNAGAARTLSRERFMAAWRCRHLPWPCGGCAVLARP
jgi:hypothetical protein